MTAPTPHKRIEVDREDLMREATALRMRGELVIPGLPEAVVAGYRDEGALSIYFSPERCYHFDAAGRVRRAFVDGHLFRTQGNTLSKLQRERSDEQVVLRRHDLTPDECEKFLAEATQYLQIVQRALSNETAAVEREVPEGASIADKLRSDLSRLLASQLTCAPPISGKR